MHHARVFNSSVRPGEDDGIKTGAGKGQALGLGLGEEGGGGEVFGEIVEGGLKLFVVCVDGGDGCGCVAVEPGHAAVAAADLEDAGMLYLTDLAQLTAFNSLGVADGIGHGGVDILPHSEGVRYWWSGQIGMAMVGVVGLDGSTKLVDFVDFMVNSVKLRGSLGRLGSQ